jgi:hypothetical protein
MTVTTADERKIETRQRIALVAGAALLAAGLILVMFVLPAEYGVGAIIAARSRPFQQETVDFTLVAHEAMEYKYRLEKGDTLLYSWSATAPINYELHAEPDGAPRGYAQSTKSARASSRPQVR